jgi:hypothetical protein
MSRYVFTIYPLPADGQPWLAVTLDESKPVDVFGCSSREIAEKILESMRARHKGKDGRSRGAAL